MEQLQQAEAAIATGDKKAAYVLLAQVLKQDQKNVDAWILLSQAADSPEQERLFLEKAARLDPLHEAVQARLAALDDPAGPADTEPAPLAPDEPPPAMQISAEPHNFDDQAKGDTLPSWLAGEEELLTLEQAPGDLDTTEPDEFLLPAAGQDVPDWLQDEPQEDWLGEPATTVEMEPAEEETWPADDVQTAVVESEPPPEPEEAEKKPPPRRGAWYEWAIAGFAILIFLLLIFFLFIR